jgi:hypothetical protein
VRREAEEEWTGLGALGLLNWRKKRKSRVSLLGVA